MALRNEITKHAFPDHHIRVAAVQETHWAKHEMNTVVLTREDYEKIKAEAMDLGWERRTFPEEIN